MTRAELAAKLEAKAQASQDVVRKLTEELAGLDGDRVKTSDGRDLLVLIGQQQMEANALSMMAQGERYLAKKEAEQPQQLS